MQQFAVICCALCLKLKWYTPCNLVMSEKVCDLLESCSHLIHLVSKPWNLTQKWVHIDLCVLAVVWKMNFVLRNVAKTAVIVQVNGVSFFSSQVCRRKRRPADPGFQKEVHHPGVRRVRAEDKWNLHEGANPKRGEGRWMWFACSLLWSKRKLILWQKNANGKQLSWLLLFCSVLSCFLAVGCRLHTPAGQVQPRTVGGVFVYSGWPEVRISHVTQSASADGVCPEF